MGSVADKLLYLEHTKEAIKSAIVAKGVSIDENTTFREYSDKISEIQGGDTQSKFEITLDNLIGNVDSDGAVLAPEPADYMTIAAESISEQSGLNYAFACKSIRQINVDVPYLYAKSLQYAFIENPTLEGVKFIRLREVGGNALYYAFRRCENLRFARFEADVDSSGTEVEVNTGSGCLSYAFYGCTALEDVVLAAFTQLTSNTQVFYNCSALIRVMFDRLHTITGVQSRMFYNCTSLQDVYYPQLTSITSSGFGTSSSNYTFAGCTQVFNIHFRADMQATIEAMSGYSAKWGATNAQIFFDL